MISSWFIRMPRKRWFLCYTISYTNVKWQTVTFRWLLRLLAPRFLSFSLSISHTDIYLATTPHRLAKLNAASFPFSFVFHREGFAVSWVFFYLSNNVHTHICGFGVFNPLLVWSFTTDFPIFTNHLLFICVLFWIL